eukprot:SM000005S17270  [mRNA]  locus=s5:1098475:1100354:+ [translate_table: standard]
MATNGAIDLAGDGGVTKRVLSPAPADALQPSEALPFADVLYEGRLEATGEVFDSTADDNTVFTFEVGRGAVIRAWDIAVKSMRVGEVAEVRCEHEYAYGEAGSPPDIPPRATLIFKITLQEVRPPKGASASTIEENQTRLNELRKEREAAAAAKEDDKKKREEAKAAAASRLQAKLDSKKKGGGKGGKK